jgi:hypothetical protein
MERWWQVQFYTKLLVAQAPGLGRLGSPSEPFLHPETERQATVDLMYSDSIHYTG